MLRLNSAQEDELHRLIADPDAPVQATGAVRDAARRIRTFFIRERGWSPQDLRRYRFRDLNDLTSDGEYALCRTRGRVEWSRGQDDLVLHLTLREAQAAPVEFREQVIQRLTGGIKVADVLHEKALALPEKDWAYIERLVETHRGRPIRKTRESGAELGQGIKTLLENAYGR